MNAQYHGGNLVTIDGLNYERVYVTMTELREMMDDLEAQYRAHSCCPSCGTLTHDGRTCDDCKRYEATRDCCEHGVPISEGYCMYCHAKDIGILCAHGVELDIYCAACDREN